MKKRQMIYAEPTTEELRGCIRDGRCWWCHKTGWKRLAQHTSMAHGISANDIREMAILLKTTPTCIKEESEVMSERTLRLIKEGKRKIPDWRLGQRVKREYSEAGLIGMRQNCEHMQQFLTPEIRRKGVEKTSEVLSKPHPCPVCGKIIPRAKPICCSLDCRKVKQNTGKVAAATRMRLSAENPEYKLRVSQVKQHQGYKKPHTCCICGKLIPKSRPRKYCSPECAQNPFQLPVQEIKEKYLSGISSIELSQKYNCCDHTIRRQLRKIGVMIRGNEVESDIEIL